MHIKKRDRLSYILSLIGDDYQKFGVGVIAAACDGCYDMSPQVRSGLQDLALLLSQKYVNLSKLGRGTQIVTMIRKIKAQLN
jgi:hypothetical protein